jgi:Tetratricopeptide repeat
MSLAHIGSGSRALAVVVVALLLAAAPRAVAQGEDTAVVDKITKMNKKAVEEYENLNFEEARKILKDALDIASQNGLDKHPIKARTHIHLGVVILGGFKQRELAMKQFRKALEIQPDIKLTKSLANPEIQEAFDEAAKPVEEGTGGEKPEGEKSEQPEKPNEPLVHKPITRATQGKPIAIEAVVDTTLGITKVVLGYRTGTGGDFLGRQMKEASPGKWISEIPASATSGDRVSYYIDAQGADGDTIASKGSADEPLGIALKGAGAPSRDEGDEEEEEGGLRRFFVGLGVGSGIGWTTGSGEVNVMHTISPAGFAPSKLLHIAPELGYFVSPTLMLSVQARLQIVSGPTPEPGPAQYCGSDMLCSTAKNAIAVLVKGTKFLSDSSKFRPYGAVAVGGGYIRHVAAFPSVGNVCGTKGNEACVDTVKAGYVLIGPAGGFFYNLTPAFALAVAVNTYLGFPDFTFHVDFNGGAAVMF